jgi:hypothetical protein
MNPSSKESSGAGSAPAVEQKGSVASNNAAEATTEQAEQTVSSREQVAAIAVPAGGVIPLPLPAAPQATAVPPATSAAAPAAPSTLVTDDDSDLIEKEWVDKAKQIVERTRDDPHKQSEALTVFKADYLKKRYGKTIKVSR